MAKLILIRGLPGSGKSTIAKQIRECGYAHYEADMYHEKDGVYQFDTANIKKAHEWCQACTKNSLDSGINVVVANTFTQKWEMQPYLDMGHDVSVIIAYGEFANIHNVPPEVIKRMRERWED